jgi:uncharacterized protein
MILVDTGPLVALFDRRDAEHDRCKHVLKGLREPLTTTTPVLTEVFSMLGPGSRESSRLREFIDRRGLSIWFLDDRSLARAFELMKSYADHPMDLADASLVAAAESLGALKVFTVDRNADCGLTLRRGLDQKVEQGARVAQERRRATYRRRIGRAHRPAHPARGRSPRSSAWDAGGTVRARA